MTNSNSTVLCPCCERVCSEDELSECAVCEEKYCYKCPGDCQCYALARVITCLNSLGVYKGLIPFRDILEQEWEKAMLLEQNRIDIAVAALTP